MSEQLPERRCPYCNKLLYKGEVLRIEIKCPRCKHIVYYRILGLQTRIKQARNGGK